MPINDNMCAVWHPRCAGEKRRLSGLARVDIKLRAEDLLSCDGEDGRPLGATHVLYIDTVWCRAFVPTSAPKHLVMGFCRILVLHPHY